MAASYRNFIYDADRGFIFAYVPKVACTNWKSLMRYMAGHADWLDSKMAHDKVNGGLRYLDAEGADAALLNDPGIRKYTMVRDPYSRTLSAYLNKVENRLDATREAPDEDHFRNAVRNIDKFRKEQLDPAAYPEINFEVFLRWLRDSGSWFTRDEHWAHQSILLRVPEIRFDIVGRFENLSEDAAEILSEMGCDVGFPSQKDVRFAPTNARSKIDLYYTDHAYELVEKIYSEDFFQFGYAKISPTPRENETKKVSVENSKIENQNYFKSKMRWPMKKTALNILRKLDVPVEGILDVGVLNGTTELIECYGDKPHLLIEPVMEFAETIEKIYRKAGVDFRLASVAAGEADGQMELLITSVDGGKKITHARLAEANRKGEPRDIDVKRIDTLVDEFDFPGPYLLKIDVDGAELRVLQGAEKTLEQTNIVVVEVQIRNFFQRSQPLIDAGFELFDIVDFCYYDERLSQFDLVFVKKETLNQLKKNLFQHGFHSSLWKKLQPPLNA